MDDKADEKGFDVGDAILIGGAAGLISDSIQEEDAVEEEYVPKAQTHYDEPSSSDLKMIRRVDPELYNMTLSVMEQQASEREKALKIKEFEDICNEMLTEAERFSNKE